MPKLRRDRALMLVALSALLTAADDPKASPRAEIDAEYKKAVAAADADRVAKLDKLAASQTGSEAVGTYQDLFSFAIAADRYKEAEAAADRFLASGSSSREVTVLAHLVNIVAEADRGEFGEALDDFKGFLASNGGQAGRPSESQSRTLLAVSEAYVRRLIKAERYDEAKSVSGLIVAQAQNPAVRDHFAGIARRLDLVGKPAPAIVGKDADGGAVTLEALKGKVVLVPFWATWCPPCVESLPALFDIADRYESEGFTVLGVNLDGGAPADAAKAVRRFIVDYAIPWPNAMNGEGAADFATAYGVTEIPANFLVGRDGKVVAIDQTGAGLVEAVSKALTAPKGAR